MELTVKEYCKRRGITIQAFSQAKKKGKIPGVKRVIPARPITLVIENGFFTNKK